VVVVVVTAVVVGVKKNYSKGLYHAEPAQTTPTPARGTHGGKRPYHGVKGVAKGRIYAGIKEWSD